jgi:uncharacterized membrane protein
MAFCANCGAEASGRFCQKCGAPVAAAPGPSPVPPAPPQPGMNPPGYQPLPPPVGAPSVGMTDNMAGALCYLFGFITGILFLVLAPYNQDRNIRFHAFQSIFLNIAWAVIWMVVVVVSLVLHAIPILGAIVAGLLYFAVSIGALIIWLYMMFKTYNGEKIVLPVVGPMAEKQAGV